MTGFNLTDEDLKALERINDLFKETFQDYKGVVF